MLKRSFCLLGIALIPILILAGCCDPENPSAPSIRYVTYQYATINGNMAVKSQAGAYLEDATVGMVYFDLSDQDATDEFGEGSLTLGPWEMDNPPSTSTITVALSAIMAGYQDQTTDVTVPISYVDVIRRVEVDRDSWGNTTAEKHITNYIYEANVSHTFTLIPLP